MVMNKKNQSADKDFNLGDLGLLIPELYMPCEDIELYRWAVVACDQHTTDREFWKETASIIGDAPSTFHMILPEIYLEKPDALSVDERISRINAYMRKAESDHLVWRLPQGCMLINRETPLHSSRLGLVIAVDLEHYDYTPGTDKLIRASEGTVMDRIPPRAAIRKEALFELPHVQLLFDDAEHTVLTPLYEYLRQTNKVPCYQTTLMQNGGHITGWFLDADNGYLQQALQQLSNLQSLISHHLLFAVGDGNHSLATAKAHWETIKAQARPDHPARYALVEIMNIHDQGLEFEPIHRIIFDTHAEDLLQTARTTLGSTFINAEKLSGAHLTVPEIKEDYHTYILADKHAAWEMKLQADGQPLAADTLQTWLDQMIISRPSFRIDYVHGIKAIKKLIDAGHTGILLPGLRKRDFFPTLASKGVLPRKTFSIGAAFEKRYYLESRKIRDS